MATFRVKESLVLRSRGMRMAIGEFVDGTVRVGDRAPMPGPEAAVAGFEMLTLLYGRPAASGCP
jgi:hypothetical protein